MWVSDHFCRARGLFVLHRVCAPAATAPPPSAQTGANGHISHFQRRPSEHKQLCLLPQPLVLAVATAPCPSRCGPFCMSSTAEGLSSPAHRLLGHYYVLKGFCFITPLCSAIFFLFISPFKRT